MASDGPPPDRQPAAESAGPGVLTPGAVVDRYLVSEKIGQGGMGAVYKAVDQRLGRPVALKVMSRNPDAESDKRRFFREAKAASALNHPNIVTIYEYGSADGVDFIAMEFVEGVTLSRLLAQGALPIETLLHYSRQMAGALGKAHAAGVVHRDLKPGNVMITPDGILKVLDFGLAKHHVASPPEAATAMPSVDLTQPGAVMGTPAYMSPEQAMGAPASPRSDVFSFGVMLYEMVGGQRPFQGSNSSAILLQVVRKEPRPIEQINRAVPPLLASLIRDCLQKDEEDRLQSMAEVESRLSAMVQTVMSADLPVAAGARAARSWRIGHPRRLWLAGAAVIALAAAALAFPFAREKAGALSLPGMAPNSRAWTDRGLAYMERYDQKGNTDLALDAFTKAIELDADNARAYSGLAETYLRKNSESPDPQWITRARGAAEKSVALNGLGATGHIWLGAALLRAGKPDEAMASLDRAAELEPRNATGLQQQANAWIARGDMVKAETALREAIALAPADWKLTNDLAVLLNRLGRYQEAAEVLETQNRATPDNGVILVNLGVIYHALGRDEEAATAIQRSMEIRPSQRGYSNLGTLLFYMGRYDSAVTAFEQALQIDANAYQTWGNLGDAYRWAPGKREQSGAAYLRASQLLDEEIARKPNDSSLLALAATYHAKRGDASKARTLLERVDLTKPDVPSAILFKAAVVEEIAGSRARALTMLEGALGRGYSRDEVGADPELLDLRKDPEYHKLVARLTTLAK